MRGSQGEKEIIKPMERAAGDIVASAANKEGQNMAFLASAKSKGCESRSYVEVSAAVSPNTFL
jgi:hypothetical protein